MYNSCWAIIPARGGSTGVVGKNIKSLGGVPLIGRSIKTLQLAQVFDRIIVTSDCEDILATAKDFGADIFLRKNPEESNNVTMPDVPTLSYLESISESLRPKYCFMCQCTAPFIKPESYYKAFKKLEQKAPATVFAAHKAHLFLWQRANEESDGSNWLPINHPFNERVGRQFAKFEQVNETGAFYGFSTAEFLKARHRFFSEAYPIIIEGNEIIDINEWEDWEFAQFVASRSEK